MKKWGRIGSPHSKKRRNWMRKIAKGKKYRARRYKGYKGRRSFIADRRQHAKHRPAKRYRRGIGSRGDW